MIKLGSFPHFTGTQLVYGAFVLYANYQVFKWVFGAVRAVAASQFINFLFKKLTPKSVVQARIAKEKQHRLDEKLLKEKEHQEALEIHRKYEYTGWWNIGFIEEDRTTLFKGYEDIKWLWGSHKIDRSKNYSPDDSKKIAWLMFVEMNAYRDQFKQHRRWSPEMEVFWNKILPKQFQPKKDFLADQLKKAEEDFDSDLPSMIRRLKPFNLQAKRRPTIIFIAQMAKKPIKRKKGLSRQAIKSGISLAVLWRKSRSAKNSQTILRRL